MLEKIKDHILRNRGKYEIVGVVVVSGIAYYIGVRSGALPKLMLKSNSVVGGINNTINQTVIATVERTGPPSYITMCDQTKEVWLSQRIAAAAKGISEGHLSSHLNGGLDHVDGLTFTRLGIAAA